MAEPPRMATGPALMEQLVQLRATLDEIAEEARAHWSREEQRMRLVDQFVDPQLNLDSLLKQIYATLARNREAMLALEAEARRLTSAVELAVGDPTLLIEREKGA
jgi:hypothetical protein